jgi:hypothetical protein
MNRTLLRTAVLAILIVFGLVIFTFGVLGPLSTYGM